MVYRGTAHKNDPVREVVFELWLDLNKELALTKYKWSIRTESQAIRILEVELKKYGEYCFPSKGTIQELEFYNGKERLVKKEEMVVNEFIAEQNMPDSLFMLSGLDLPPNAIIEDKITNTSYPYKTMKNSVPKSR
ncbi:MAG: hypothetical protein BWY73_00960 [candidate division TA06 bacterium ADurb.Bin417]|uniref:Uncharacterized protein n=1 Tax=candidate division TA06 bacterium ADurb.Bin417 TaxID=1852828 RepID=A0A1V5MFU9_UNCT6|nr:MAG: hypothetical protein BWY73_00960 [candidate division TA06 bacterium ADurb.Bin417]